jgi:FAD:protein FMN transferase
VIPVEQIMGLPVSLDIRRAPAGVAADAARGVFDSLREADRRFSPFLAGSEVSRFGRGELTPATTSAELAEILDLCALYERASSGAFRAWLPGRAFDPCGIVKGWAVQRAADLLRDNGIQAFCLNAGGDVVAAGEPEPGRPWAVGIRHPERQHQVCAVLAVRDRAVATSGNYERGAHILDGRTGEPVRDLLSLTVVAEDLTTADAVSTAAFAMGAAGPEWAGGQPGCLVFAVDARQRVFRSDALDDLLTPAGRMG